MKNIKFLFLLAVLGYFGCSDPVLDTKPGDSYNEAVVYSDIALAEKLVYYNYNVTENWGMNFADWWTRRIGIENASDESWFHWATNTRYTTNLSSTTPSNMGFYRETWPVFWRYVGAANNFLSKIEGSEIQASNPEETNALKGEMKYLRALAYQQMINFWGGVPLVTEPVPLESAPEFRQGRASYQECVEFIVKELDEAVKLLPEGPRKGAEFGRASRAAALALKSRVLLYAASDLHDPALAPQTTDKELYTYSKANKWQEAADAAKAVMDLPDYALQTFTSSEQYHDFFLTPNSELIFGRPYNSEDFNVPNDANTMPDKAHGTVANGGWGLSNPTHNFVQDFKMANGLHIDEPGSGYDGSVENIYANREMRFYANINYQGASFMGKELEYWSPFGNCSKDLPGNDGKHFAATGYNLRKFLDESITVDVTQSPNRPFPLARLPEMYLNYAEAQFRAGNEGEARWAVSQIAERVGLPAITSTGEKLLEDIKYERKMELFFEHHRFYDLRRWMDTEAMAAPVIGVQWVRMRNGRPNPRGELEMIGPNVLEIRDFNTEDYYLPIQQDEIEKTSMRQNFGYN
ncbi:RagB/SusD family nutrient uptake outer membrane protein [Algibacter mikhailovii]|uniref:RagB/SusD family nutrient uptake outer membrane protein n=1 Tax=Algibacter mikhailovii TaxID=425498 RepID=UPI0024948D4D|nr:RagB/SusD family nutrient uptake outer membrane protein [Algibacter mikhailovii]